MIYSFFLLAQAPATAAPAGPSSIFAGPLVPFVCIGLIFYLLMIRPQQRKAKEQASLISSLRTGDKVVACGGIHGIIANVKETTILLKVADNFKIEVDKASIGTVVKRTEAEADAAT